MITGGLDSVVAKHPEQDQFSKKEADRRFRAALQGAFNTPPKPLKSMTRKRPEAQRKKTKAPKRGS
jgi:hypothetical protein